ncbi:MAG: hypothetical protein WC121_06480 [Candidatus Kapaibacterium sp.]
MRAIKDPVRETYGMDYSARFTDEFEKLIELAKEKIEPFSKKEISYWTYYFEINGEDVASEFDCCDDVKCIEQTKTEIKEQYGEDTQIEEVYYDNDGDHERIEICSQCGKPLNEWLTWCGDELKYIEENEWTADFLKEEAFLIHCIFQSMPTCDNRISEYAKHQGGDVLTQAIENRELFFQRIGKLAQCVIGYF